MEKIGKIDRVLFSTVLFVFAVVTTVHALSFPGNARWLPLGTGSIVSAIMAILIASEFSPRISKFLGVYHGLLEEMSVGADEDEEPEGEPPSWGKIAMCWGWIFVCVMIIFLVGFISIPLYIIVQLRVFSHAKWIPSIITTLIIFGFMYFIYTILNLELWPGIIFGGIVPPL